MSNLVQLSRSKGVVSLATAAPAVTPPCEDTKVEQVLEAHGVDWQMRPRLAMDKINVTKSRQLQVRQGEPMDEDHAQSIAISIEEGAIIPPLLVYTDRDGRYIILDGIHRHAAYELLDRRTICAYELLKPTPNQLRLVVVKINSTHGKPLTMTQRIHHAIDLHTQGNMTLKALSTHLSIPHGRLQKALAVRRVEDRLGAMGLQNRHLSTTHMERLDNLKSDVVLKETFKLTHAIQLPTDEHRQLVTEVNRKRTEAAQLQTVERLIAKHKAEVAASASGIMRFPKTLRSFKAAIGMLANLDVKTLTKDAHQNLSAEGIKELQAKMKEAAMNLREARSKVV